MYRVLLPVDRNEEHTRSQMETLTSLPAFDEPVEVVVLHVYERIDTVPDEAGATYIEDINESLPELQGRPETVETVLEELAALDVETSVHEMVGEPATAIQSVAEAEDVDVVLVGVRKRSPVGKVIFGSVSQAVLLDSDRPVLIAP